ncbi:hypothetical protein D0C16_05435 [Cellvibrio sp. KY-GH-1]|uniref:phage tail assembly chaperone family protein, TAC n=1 Tax=Cellvibrio sp. KY-GH-1 TaxID=2303332 RepID=UPI001249054D|nr:phage tail assembly chaperone family protein, TAC [Cellvibrio sp. KY-GH-1]QEY15464.1 hypothetical protein D0C16_05435 [Cellvibrio sp. KY-GH-1]
MNLNLSELLTKGSAVAGALKKVPVTWVDTDDDGKEVETKFDIYVRTKIPFAANDRIFNSPVNGDEDSRNSRIISELVRFGDGTEQMSIEEAANLKPTLGYVLVNAVFASMPKRTAEDAPAKKKSARAKRSGTN